MFVLVFAAVVAAVVLSLLRIPSVWRSLLALDDPSDAHELGMALVAARKIQAQHIFVFNGSNKGAGNPFRESGPPACMAKLIMLRHKVSRHAC
jgi:hypothetical protein